MPLALGPTSVVGGTTAAAYWGLLEGLTGPVEMLLPDGCSRAARGVRVRRVPQPRSLAHPARLPPVLSPSGDRQRRVVSTGGRTAYRDVEYLPFGVIVELDGRRGHEGESGVLRDQERDNAAVLTGCATLRFGWQAVAAQPCEVARQVIGLLRLRGWTGVGRACGPACTAAALC